MLLCFYACNDAIALSSKDITTLRSREQVACPHVGRNNEPRLTKTHTKLDEYKISICGLKAVWQCSVNPSLLGAQWTACGWGGEVSDDEERAVDYLCCLAQPRSPALSSYSETGSTGAAWRPVQRGSLTTTACPCQASQRTRVEFVLCDTADNTTVGTLESSALQVNTTRDSGAQGVGEPINYYMCCCDVVILQLRCSLSCICLVCSH